MLNALSVMMSLISYQLIMFVAQNLVGLNIELGMARNIDARILELKELELNRQ